MLCFKVETRLHYCNFNPQFPYLYSGGRGGPGYFPLWGSVTLKTLYSSCPPAPWLHLSSNLTRYYVALEAQISKNMGPRAEYSDLLLSVECRRSWTRCSTNQKSQNKEMVKPIVTQRLHTNKRFTDIIFISEWPFQEASADKEEGGGAGWRQLQDVLEFGLTPEQSRLAG